MMNFNTLPQLMQPLTHVMLTAVALAEMNDEQTVSLQLKSPPKNLHDDSKR